MTNAQLTAELSKLDGDLPARVVVMLPDGSTASYDITGVMTGPADFGQQVCIAIS